MIPKEAFAAIAAVMCVSCAFGYVLRAAGKTVTKAGMRNVTYGIHTLI